MDCVNHKCYGRASSETTDFLKLVAQHLEKQGYLTYRRKGSRAYLLPNVTFKGLQWLGLCAQERASFPIVVDAEALRNVSNLTHGIKTTNSDNLEKLNTQSLNHICEYLCPSDIELKKQLFKLRTELATELQVMPYMIASNLALFQTVCAKPTTLDQLRACKLDGFYESKYERFGLSIVNCVKVHLNNQQISATADEEDLINITPDIFYSVRDTQFDSALSDSDNELSELCYEIEQNLNISKESKKTSDCATVIPNENENSEKEKSVTETLSYNDRLQRKKVSFRDESSCCCS